jgi:hypothetical protein
MNKIFSYCTGLSGTGIHFTPNIPTVIFLANFDKIPGLEHKCKVIQDGGYGSERMDGLA